ncbi:MAG TPA: hypothetical protein VFD13_07725 [Candidatus Kapabacteria bacterium]|nr:hypothetical protein [Candidatus Kapabacteria bacterium]
MAHRTFHTSLVVILLALALGACATTQMPFHGFADQASLNQNDAEVTRESAANGPLDPMNLAKDDQEYAHANIAYDRIEEGYYQWGAKLYGRGYRDIYYVEDLAPKAFGHEMEDTYEHAIEAGFKDAASKNTSQK